MQWLRFQLIPLSKPRRVLLIYCVIQGEAMQHFTRRAFISSSVAPLLVPASARGANDRVVMGVIGVGGMGGGHLRALVNNSDVRVAAVCDVMSDRRNRAKDSVNTAYKDNSCVGYNDFRELLARPDIDAVLIAVPDHWHALIGTEAARRGKHMYYEKPMGVSLAESKAMREAVQRYGVVFQFGTQQRSSFNYRQTIELIRNGRIGELKTIMIASAGSQYVPNQPAQPVPEGFDYEMWLGPAPWVPYTYERCTRNWTLIYDYSLGCISGAWGVHDVDIAQWANDADHTGPIEVEGTGAYPADGLYDTAIQWEIEHTYANGVKLLHMDRRTANSRAKQFSMGTMASLFIGTEGWIYVSRAALHTHPASLVREKFKSSEFQVVRSDDHRRNFLEAVRKGGTPLSPIEAAVRADTVCQQADIAMRLKRKLRWDPVKEMFTGDEQANRMLARPMRSPWHL
jgi:predicted dehydrogenase